LSEGFTKVYGDRLLNSSIWLESMEVRLLWLTVLAKADENGFVNTPSAKVLAHVANMPLEAVRVALEVLEAPDPDSRTPDNDGRRLERVQGGWVVLNHRTYRDIRTTKQLADAERQQRARDRERDASRGSRDESPDLRDQRSEDRDQKEIPDAREPARKGRGDQISGSATMEVHMLIGSEALTCGWTNPPHLNNSQLRSVVERIHSEQKRTKEPFGQIAQQLVRAGLLKARAHNQSPARALLEAEVGAAYLPFTRPVPKRTSKQARADARAAFERNATTEEMRKLNAEVAELEREEERQSMSRGRR
jgi:hypothetical protein